jgi:cobalamin-dependent methionine synthase I
VAMKNEKRILDKGYDAVREMAREMVAAGADISDILWHANQLWHEFKESAFLAGAIDVSETGMYMDQYNAELTGAIIARSRRYANGVDAEHVEQQAQGIAKVQRAGR